MCGRVGDKEAEPRESRKVQAGVRAETRRGTRRSRGAEGERTGEQVGGEKNSREGREARRAGHGH